MEIHLLARFLFLLYAFFTAFRLFALFLFVTFLYLNFSAWAFLHGFGFWIRTFFTWRIFFLFVASLPELHLFPGARLLCFRDFSEGPSLFSFSGTALLFSVSTRKCLFPFNAHLRLNRIRCRRVSGLWFPAIFIKGAVIIYLYCLRREPASARIDAPTVTLYPIRWNPACRLSVEPEHFTVLSFICFQSLFSVFSKPRALPKRGYFLAFKSLFHRFFSFALSLSFFRFSFRKIVFYVIIFHWILLGFLPYFIVFYEHMAWIFAVSADI